MKETVRRLFHARGTFPFDEAGIRLTRTYNTAKSP